MFSFSNSNKWKIYEVCKFKENRYIFYLLIEKKSGGTKDENVIATWGNGELRIVKATDILQGEKTVVGNTAG